jgi:hypothetical protein
VELEIDGARRLLAHLPCWRAPEVAQAWSAHEEAAAALRAKSIAAVTADELAQRIAEHDPHYTGADIPSTLEQLAADGLATTEAGGWAQSQAGTDLLTGGRAQAHSDHVAAALGVEGAETIQEAPHE